MDGKRTLRYEEIDIAKGLGMLAVIWGHLMLGGSTNRMVYAFHILLFFFLSGLMFRREKHRNFGHFLRHRARTLLVPYGIFSAVTWMYWVVRNKALGLPVKDWFAPLLQTVIAQGSGGFLVHNVALWFVTCLFVVEVLYYFLGKLPPWAAAVGCMLCGAAGWWMVQPHEFFDFKLLPWNAEGALTGVVFYGAGNLLAGRVSRDAVCDRVQRHPWGNLLLAGLLAVALFFGARFNGHVTIGQGILGDYIWLFYANAVCGILAVMVVSILLSRFGGKWATYLKWLGRNSFYAMAIHVPVMVDVVWLVAKLCRVDLDALRYCYYYTVPAFVVIVLLTSGWIWLLRFVGRWCRTKCKNKNVASV